MQKFLSTLLRFKLIYHDKTTYDGTREKKGRRREKITLWGQPNAL